jgi:hypothetical protein
MSVDKHTLQKWVAGAEVRFKKTRKRFAKVPLVNRIGKLSESKRNYILAEKVDLTRARDFCAQETSEDILFASLQLPIIGKRGIGNDVGIAVASFNYTDKEGDEHKIIAICAYTVSGVVRKTRELKHTIMIPMA